MKLDRKILDELEIWHEELKPLKMSELFKNGGKNIAFVSVDMINGFCCEGALSSPRVGAIAKNLADTFKRAHDEFGFKNFILIQDNHGEKASEFDAFPPHAVAGTNEAETIDELKNLDFFDEIKIFYKNSISSAYCDGFNRFLEQNRHVDTFVIFGDCTDLCVYNLALHIKLSANEKNIKREVIVVSDLVQTYDAPWHNGDFYHLVFLRHMQIAANIKVVKSLN
ncbi:cysteine hydrolase family protein [Campylobacter sp. RM16192]|uniref:cysteine hydrolase family protein n=1 Tax=Campylobacter sp. RM16192 TaxID=1660080 RepID=UPI001451B125|nr:isochorismatase family cysteine hydrolase [Campylobacter sp. RM16192]QCD53011.1 pyrazinamidase / nicotinamidase [Campylobacter sp. RM16192]